MALHSSAGGTFMTWTTEQILLLAPDPASASAGRGLAAARHWVSGGSTVRTIWGECQGSGSRPYQVQIDLAEPAFRCTCPSRKFPCKHGIALFLLYANDTSVLSQKEQPEWVNEWLSKRDAKSVSPSKSPEKKASDEVVDAAAQEKRAADREARVAAGLEELDLWLCDLIRVGLAASQTQPQKYWQNIAARMVDAQAPGFARRLREMALIPASGAGWESRLLEQIALLRLLMEGYRRIEAQSEEMQATIRGHVGWTVRQEDLVQQPGVRAEWLVVGKRLVEEDKMIAQRTWLLCEQGSGSTDTSVNPVSNPELPGSALLLHFSVRGQAPEPTYPVGSAIDAELVYFPGAFKQRAVIKARHGESVCTHITRILPDFEALMHAYASTLSQDPWVETILAAVAEVTPVSIEDAWFMCDGVGVVLPIDRSFQLIWSMMAISGGHPITLHAEWNGSAPTPLSVENGDLFVSF
jgi:hypothetical protein